VTVVVSVVVWVVVLVVVWVVVRDVDVSAGVEEDTTDVTEVELVAGAVTACVLAGVENPAGMVVVAVSADSASAMVSWGCNVVNFMKCPD
jgi:hypothetical protein